MKNILKTALVLSMGLISSGVSAQFTLGAEISPRTEFRHGYQTLIDSAQSPSIFTVQRTRLNFGYAADKFKVGISLQDVRIWGSQSQLNVTDGGLSTLHAAWGQYWFCPKFSAKVGRQELSYNDERLFGATNWQPQGRAHDMILLAFEDTAHKFTAHFGEAYNANSTAGNTGASYIVGSSYKEMQFLWLNKKFGPVNASIIAINSGAQSPVAINSTRYMQTAGAFVEYKKKALYANLRGYYQMGVDAAKKDVQASLFGVEVAYTLKEKLTFRAGCEIISGQSQTDTAAAYMKVTHNFNTLYGTGHKFNGYMDYYYAGSAFGNVGLNDIYVKAEYKTDKYKAGVDVHLFSANADVLDMDELLKNGKISAMSASLGTEIDLTLGYNFSKMFSMQFGYSQMLATATTEAVKGGKYSLTQNWAYLMFTFKPTFL